MAVSVSLISSNSIISSGYESSAGSGASSGTSMVSSNLLSFSSESTDCGSAPMAMNSGAIATSEPAMTPAPGSDTTSFSVAASESMPASNYPTYTPPAPAAVGSSLDFTA